MEAKLTSWYRILAPRPVVLVSTVNSKGVSNAAPFSFVMPVSFKPPLIGFASSPAHDTAKNIQETKDFVINLPSLKILKNLWTCADEFPSNVSEFKKANLTEEKSSKVKSPGIKECFARFECRLSNQFEVGDHIIFVGEVLKTDIMPDYIKNGKYLVEKSNVLMHIGEEEFGLLGKIVKAE